MLLRSLFSDALLGILSSKISYALEEGQSILRSSSEDIPLLGFGTWNVPRSNASDVVVAALDTGYRHLDCAAIYGNEKEVGAGIQAGLAANELSRGDIWVTSKLWNDHHAPSDVPKALDQTLSDLGLDYLDLYLMHWPVSKTADGKNAIDYLATWQAMTKLLATNRVRHVGVSNFSPSQLQALIDATPQHVPFAHQMELHPYLPQSEFLKMHERNGIHVTSYSPFGNTNPTYGSLRKENAASAVPPLLESPLLISLAEKIGCTPPQIALAFGIQRGTSVTPKSSNLSHIEENYQVSNCKLSAADISSLETELPIKRFNNPSKSWGVPLYDGLEDADVHAAVGSSMTEAVEGYKVLKGVGSAWMKSLWNMITGLERDL